MRNEIEKLVAICEQMLQDSKDLESIILFLRRRSGRKTTSIEVVARLLNVSISKAKSLIHASQTWSDVRGRDEAFEQMVLTALEQLGKEQDE